MRPRNGVSSNRRYRNADRAQRRQVAVGVEAQAVAAGAPREVQRILVVEARADALLNEEDFDQAPYLEVFYREKWRRWGMSTTPSGTTLQASEAHEEIGLDPCWASAPFRGAIPALAEGVHDLLGRGHPCWQLHTEHLAGCLFAGGKERAHAGGGAGAMR